MIPKSRKTLYDYFDQKKAQILKSLKSTSVDMETKVDLIKELEVTDGIIRKTFQNSLSTIDYRALMSSICKSVSLNSAVQVSFLVKMLESIPGYEINFAYIIEKYIQIKGQPTKECSKNESSNIITSK